MKNFVRAVSFVTGFVIKPAGDGSSLSYVTQSDPKGILNLLSSADLCSGGILPVHIMWLRSFFAISIKSIV